MKARGAAARMVLVACAVFFAGATAPNLAPTSAEVARWIQQRLDVQGSSYRDRALRLVIASPFPSTVTPSRYRLVDAWPAGVALHRPLRALVNLDGDRGRGDVQFLDGDPILAFNRFVVGGSTPLENDGQAIQRAIAFVAVSEPQDSIFCEAGVADELAAALGFKVDSGGRYRPVVAHESVVSGPEPDAKVVELTSVVVYSQRRWPSALVAHYVVFNKHGLIREYSASAMAR